MVSSSQGAARPWKTQGPCIVRKPRAVPQAGGAHRNLARRREGRGIRPSPLRPRSQVDPAPGHLPRADSPQEGRQHPTAPLNRGAMLLAVSPAIVAPPAEQGWFRPLHRRKHRERRPGSNLDRTFPGALIPLLTGMRSRNRGPASRSVIVTRVHPDPRDCACIAGCMGFGVRTRSTRRSTWPCWRAGYSRQRRQRGPSWPRAPRLQHHRQCPLGRARWRCSGPFRLD